MFWFSVLCLAVAFFLTFYWCADTDKCPNCGLASKYHHDRKDDFHSWTECRDCRYEFNIKADY